MKLTELKELEIGALVVDDARPPTVESLCVILSVQDGKAVTSRLLARGGLHAALRVAALDRLRPAPEGLLADLTRQALANANGVNSAAAECERWLERLEGFLLGDVVPGRESDYLRELTQLLPQAEQAWSANLRVNREVLGEILEADVTLAARVEQLRAEQGELVAGLCHLWERVLEPSWASASAARRRAIEALREDLLAWIQSARAHERAVLTWLTEAHFRDRGGQGS
ncbi:MAG: hypothetical protein R3F62_20580 [Planctomycetota bacterium]